MRQAALSFDRPVRQMADTSRQAFERILPTLSERELAVLIGLHDYCDATGFENATGAELADFLGSLRTSTRPRLNGLERKGYAAKTPARASRAAYEGKCHGYAAIVSRAAIDRAQRTQGKAERGSDA